MTSKLAKVLTEKGRKQIKEENFALPGRRYPIQDAVHARNALARVAQHGTPEEQATVKAKVEKKYPGIEQRGGKTMDESRKKRILEKVAMEPVQVQRGQSWIGLAKNLGYKGGWKKLQDELVSRGGSRVIHPGQTYGYDDAGNVMQISGPRMSSKMREYAQSRGALEAPAAKPTPPAVPSAPAAQPEMSARQLNNLRQMAIQQQLNVESGKAPTYGMRGPDVRGMVQNLKPAPVDLGATVIKPSSGSQMAGADEE